MWVDVRTETGKRRSTQNTKQGVSSLITYFSPDVFFSCVSQLSLDCLLLHLLSLSLSPSLPLSLSLSLSLSLTHTHTPFFCKLSNKRRLVGHPVRHLIYDVSPFWNWKKRERGIKTRKEKGRNEKREDWKIRTNELRIWRWEGREEKRRETKWNETTWRTGEKSGHLLAA